LGGGGPRLNFSKEVEKLLGNENNLGILASKTALNTVVQMNNFFKKKETPLNY